MYAIVATDRQGNVDVAEGKLNVLPYFWNADSLAYEVATVNATTGTGQEVVVTNAPPVSQSGTWTVGQGTPGSSANPWWTRETNPSTGGGAGSTQVDVRSISSSTAHIGDVSISSGSVSVSSGVVLGPSTAAVGLISSGSQTIGTVINASGTQTIGTVLNASSTATIGTVGLSSGTQTIGSVVQGSAGSSATPWWASLSSGTILGPSTAAIGQISSGSQTIGTVINATSTATIGTVIVQQSHPFSSGNVSRTTVNTSVDVSLIAANANRRALVIASLSTAQVCALGLTTAAMTTALGNVSLYLEPNKQVIFGMPGSLPLYQGPVRGINISSTAVAGGVSVLEFT